MPLLARFFDANAEGTDTIDYGAVWTYSCSGYETAELAAGSCQGG